MSEKKRQLLVVTDLDGTLLDKESYSWAAADNALEQLRRRGAPLVLNSSKTLAEMQVLARELATDAPVVAENGAVIGLPVDSALAAGCDWEEKGAYYLKYTGIQREFILEIAHGLRRDMGLDFDGFADWTVGEIAQCTGLDEASAERASQRLATEPIKWRDSDARWADFSETLATHEIRALRGGRFTHLMGKCDKADGLWHVRCLYETLNPEIHWITVALGDSPNDLNMLTAADIAVVIPDAQGRRLQPSSETVIHAGSAGPAGWQECMTKILRDYID